MNIIVALIAAAILTASGWRVLRHESDIRPALVTPAMNVHDEFSGDLTARVYRVVHERTAPDRTTRPKLIALTFDDGPYPVFTPLLLDELRDLHVPATFFLIGRDAEQWPELTQRIEEEGNEIADHTYSHPNLDQESPEQVREELARGRDVLWSLSRDPSVKTLMRPPHGRYTEETLRTVQEMGYEAVLWTYDSGDWRTLTSAQIAAEVTTHATAPEIVLLHNGKLATVEALPEIVERFEKAGYEFVTAGELLRRTQAEELNHPVRRSV